MYKRSRTEPLDARVYAALSRPSGWIGLDGRRYTIRHFEGSDGNREGMRYHVLQNEAYPAVAWSRIEKLYRLGAMYEDPDVRWFFRSEAESAR